MQKRALYLVAASFLTAVNLAGGRARAAEPTAVPLTADRLRLSNTTLTPNAGGSEGIRLTFGKADWPSVWFSSDKAYQTVDWSDRGGVAFTVHNPDNTPLALNLRIDDSPQADGTHHCRSGYDTLAPGETATLVIPLGASAPGMHAGPPLINGNNVRALTMFGDPLNQKNIVAFQVFLNHPSRPRTLDLISVRLLPMPDLNGIVDQFGQYAKADWPGKIHDTAELHRAADAERAWLAAHPPLSDRDEYGGWASGPKLKATGAFRTALVKNNKEQTPPSPGEALPAGARWWLVTPSGHLFWSAGVTGVRPYDEAPISGREYMFTSLPAGTKQQGNADFFFQNIRQRYSGDDWMARWANESNQRLQSLGFNTIANWSEPAVYRAHKVPYVVPLGVWSGLPMIAATQGNNSDSHSHLPDYFDERFPQLAHDFLVKGMEPWKDDPWCLGCFVDNELMWDTWAQMGTGGQYVVAREALTAPATLAARRAFVTLLQKRYATPADWAKAWGIAVSDWNAPLTLKPSDLNEAAKRDCSAFTTALAERYFSVIKAAVREAAPNKLYLGCRFAIRPPEVVAVAGRYCDVVSFNIYEDTVDARTWNFTERQGKPVVIGEYHFGATDRGLFSPGLRSRPNQAERAAAYEAYVRSVRALPAFVGCHWFQWVDEPLIGRFDGENYNIGFVTITDTLYPEMCDAARRVNATLYRSDVPVSVRKTAAPDPQRSY